MNEGKILIKIYKDKEKFRATKLNVFETLLNIRNYISTNFNLSNFYFFDKNNFFIIEKNNEQKLILNEILINNNTIFITTNLSLIEISVYLNKNQIFKFKCLKNENVKNFIKIISNKIPNDSNLVLDGFIADIKEFENDNIINILDNNNNVYFTSKNNFNFSNETKLIKFKINGKEKFLFKVKLNITLAELRNYFQEIQNQQNFFIIIMKYLMN